jgi:hypothetical protein
MREAQKKNKPDFTQDLEIFLDKVTTHPLFLEGVSALLNFNSYRKIFIQRSLQTVWKTLELPNKRDQEKTLFVIQELQYQVQKLEKELAGTKEKENAAAAKKSSQGNRKTAESTKVVLTALQ